MRYVILGMAFLFAMLWILIAALALTTWWECRDGRQPKVRVVGNVAHIDRLCPGQSVTPDIAAPPDERSPR